MASYTYIFKYIIIGDSGVGKSCFMLQFIDRRFKSNHDLTIGVEFGSRTIKVYNKSIKLQIWDTAGQESFRSLTRSYYRGAIGALLLFDISKRESFIHIDKWLTEVKIDGNHNIVITLVGNKIDLESQREVSHEEAKAYADQHNMMYIEASARTSYKVDNVFVESVETILSAIENGKIVLSVYHPGILVGDKTKTRENAGKKSGCKC